MPFLVPPTSTFPSASSSKLPATGAGPSAQLLEPSRASSLVCLIPSFAPPSPIAFALSLTILTPLFVVRNNRGARSSSSKACVRHPQVADPALVASPIKLASKPGSIASCLKEYLKVYSIHVASPKELIASVEKIQVHEFVTSPHALPLGRPRPDPREPHCSSPSSPDLAPFVFSLTLRSSPDICGVRKPARALSDAVFKILFDQFQDKLKGGPINWKMMEVVDQLKMRLFELKKGL